MRGRRFEAIKQQSRARTAASHRWRATRLPWRRHLGIWCRIFSAAICKPGSPPKKSPRSRYFGSSYCKSTHSSRQRLFPSWLNRDALSGLIPKFTSLCCTRYSNFATPITSTGADIVNAVTVVHQLSPLKPQCKKLRRTRPQFENPA